MKKNLILIGVVAIVMLAIIEYSYSPTLALMDILGSCGIVYLYRGFIFGGKYGG